jgi:hypothetical protein
VDDRALARQFAFGRIAMGAALLVVPGLVAAPWVGRETASRPGVHVLLRALGVRDLVLGLGLKTALDRDAAGDDLPRSGRVLVGALAGSSVLLGAWLRRSAELGPAAPEATEYEAARAGAASLTSP